MAAQDGDTLDILIYGDITSWDWDEKDVSSYNLAQLIEKSNAKEIRVRINSYGGEVAEGLAIYNTLKSHPAQVTTVCDGFACSAASVVFMAGDERIMKEASLLMIHNAWSYASGNAKELRKAADDLEKISEAAANAYRAVMSISEEELKRLLDEETWILSEEALSYGFATVTEAVTASERQQYSVRNKVFAQLTGKKTIEVPPAAARAETPEPGALQLAAGEVPGRKKLFEKFKRERGESE